MKEVTNSTAVMLDLVNPTTGEVTTVTGTSIEQTNYYNISKITTRINSMDIFTLMSKVCKSSKDIEVFNALVDTHNSENKIIITNTTALAKELGVGRTKLSTMLKNLVEEKFLHKYSTGNYLINGFMYVGKRVRSNAMRERVQQEWKQLREQIAGE